jgi:hypothetical protein
MTYIFFSDNKWFLHEGDLPVKPERLTYFGPESLAIIFYEQELKHYNQSIADIKAKALEIANPELLDSEFDTAFIIENANILAPKVEFYQWPGTFETLHYSDENRIHFQMAHLVLPPEEKNMNSDIVIGLEIAIKRLENEIQQWLIVYPNPQPGTIASYCIDTLNQAIRNIRELDIKKQTP